MNKIITLAEWQTGIVTGIPINSWMGTPVIMPVVLGKAERETVQNGKRVTLKFGGWDLPPTTVLRFSRSKRIVATEMIGSDSTVKEFTGFSDWKISLDGIIIPTSRGNYGYNDEDVKKLRLLDEFDVMIPIYNPICEFLGIYDVVIENIELGQMNGNGQPFSLTLISDKYENLLI